jgi:hypothetical protein
MISIAPGILKRLNAFINTDDLDYILTNKISIEINDLTNDIEEYFESSNKLLKQKSNTKGLNGRYCRLDRDVSYRIGQAFLHGDEIRQQIPDQIICVAARMIICRKVTLSHLKTIKRLIGELDRNAEKLQDRQQQHEGLRCSIRIGRQIDQIRGYGREVCSAIDDYRHFYNLASHLLGDKIKDFGIRQKADVYGFQLDAAIRELFVSRTESCDAAPFLLRSHLELKIRRLIFNRELMKEPIYSPSKKLTVSEMLSSCQRNGIHFNYSNEILNLLLENLNLVVHFGYKLNAALLWYIYYIISDLHVYLSSPASAGKPEEALKEGLINVLKDLEKRKLVIRTEETKFFKKSGINIFWRY